MTNIGNIVLAEGIGLPAESPAQPAEPPAVGMAAPQEFAAVLAGATCTTSTMELPVIASESVPQAADLPAEEAAEETPEEAGQTDDEGAEPDAVEADQAVLTSCLAMWQILPMTPVAPRPAEPDDEISLGADGNVQPLDRAGKSPEPPAVTPRFRERPTTGGQTPPILAPVFGSPLAVNDPSQPNATQSEFAAAVEPAVSQGVAIVRSSPAQPGAIAPADSIEIPEFAAPITGAAIAETPIIEQSVAGVPVVDSSVVDASGQPGATAGQTLPDQPAMPNPGPAATAVLTHAARLTRMRPNDRPPANSETTAATSDIELARAVRDSGETPRAKGDGIPVAKVRAMAEPVLHNQATPAAAAFAEGKVVRASDAGAPAASSPSANSSPEGHTPVASVANVSPLFTRHEAPPAAEAEATPEKVAVVNAARVIQHVERAIERMRAQDGQRIEVRLPLRDGEEVIVKLRVEQGAVKAVFQTGSEGLRHALETGWTQLSQSSTDRVVRLGPAVFESSAPQSDSGGFQQSPDHRSRGEGALEQDADRLPPPMPRDGRRSAEPRLETADAAPAANIQLYA